MIPVTKKGIVLKKRDLEFENEGVLNPAVIKDGDTIHMFYRAVRKGNHSSIGYCSFTDPLTVGTRNDEPILFPQFNYESKGVEDPRIVKIDDTFYLSYTAYDGNNALGALALSKDLKHFDKIGLVVPKMTYHTFCHLAESKSEINEKYLRYNDNERFRNKLDKEIYVWDKNVVFFPRRINDKLYFMHRIKPDIQLVCIHELSELTHEFWENYFLQLDECILLSPKFKHEVSYIGGGCPPIETKEGWLVIYHSVHDTIKGYVYCACAALLDLNNPQKEISRLPYALFKPDQEWELKGEVNNVCFPTGAVVLEDELYIYYGAADEQIACATVSLSGLVEELLTYIHVEAK
jgi:beta-1,2-mannobiose phosphorylase / 1,2-beta-oligomannan phosphorylase